MAKKLEKEYFPGIGKIKFEGNKSKNPLAFKWYDPDQVVSGKKMKDHLRFAIAYWHSFCGDGRDQFGDPTHVFEWDRAENNDDKTRMKLDAAFEFFTKIGTGFYCFHDVDVVGNGSVLEIEKRLEKILPEMKKMQKQTGVKLLWGTANLFSHPRYMNGAATNPDFAVLPHVATQMRNAIQATIELGGENYVFWGGREGYLSLHNTDMKRELDHMAMMLSLARDYGRKNGFRGTFLIEPKPMEPTKHQYDYDSGTVIGFLRKYGLDKDFKLISKLIMQHLQGTHLYTIYRLHLMQACSGALMPTREIHRTDGIQTSSRQMFMRSRKQLWLFCRQADSKPAE